MPLTGSVFILVFGLTYEIIPITCIKNHLSIRCTNTYIRLSSKQSDVWDTLGTNLQNITKDISKWTIDKEGTQQRFHGRNKDQRKIAHETHDENALHDISEANGGELHSTDLTPDTISNFLNEQHDVAIVDYFAPWCIWCQRLAPTWEKFAQEIHTQHSHVNKLGVGKVDCVAQQQMCKDERIMAFPTLRWYENGKAVMPDYRGDRTVDALVEYATNRINKNYDDGEEEFNGEHHPGCQVSGHLMVNRVPGNLHMEAKSTNHAINSAMTNLTHRVHHFSFGSPDGPGGHLSDHLWQEFFPFYSDIPKKYQHTNPMKEKYYPTYHFHEAFHHHLKVISMHMNSFHTKILYQILEESQLVMYDVQNVPEIKFLWDMSPMSVNLVKETDKHWYDYITSLLAIIGGTYTTLGLINRTLLGIFKCFGLDDCF